jgi:pescadillo protein
VATANGSTEGNVSSAATLHPTLGGKATSVLAANLSALQLALNDASKGNSAVDAVKDAMINNEGEREEEEIGETTKVDRKATKASKKKQRELMQSIDEALKGVKEDDDSEDEDEDMVDQDDDEEQVPIAAPLREALEAIDDSAMQSDETNNAAIITDPAAQKRHQLFHNLTFFLSREVPRGYLELIILSYGGQVGWEGQDSPIPMDDSSITHHVIDRPKLLPGYAKLPKSREFVQPQWILDCANFNFVLPVKKYSVGSELPPHLSPWVDDKEEGYVPKYKEEVEKLRNGEMLDDEEDEAQVAENDTDEEKSASDEEDKKEDSLVKAKITEDDEDGSGSESSSEEEEDDDEAERKAMKKKRSEDEEAAQLAKALMSKKSARLYGRMQHGIAQKQAKVDNLHKKRREIESTREKSKDGKTFQKLKVERLKSERKDKEAAYAETGGSMKKKRRKN